MTRKETHMRTALPLRRCMYVSQEVSLLCLEFTAMNGGERADRGFGVVDAVKKSRLTLQETVKVLVPSFWVAAGHADGITGTVVCASNEHRLRLQRGGSAKPKASVALEWHGFGR